MTNPVLLVHGIWDTSERFNTMRSFLVNQGIAKIQGIDLKPNDGSVPIAVLAQQVHEAARHLQRAYSTPMIDVVGFSMGALVSRYWIQRLGGKSVARRFVSISGPHHGTFHAKLSRKVGARDMRPNSELLKNLAEDTDPWGKVRVHCFWTPLDLMIVPARSSQLPGVVEEKTFPVALHGWMLRDTRVLTAIADALKTLGFSLKKSAHC
jgi:triacylglycerol lipase